MRDLRQKLIELLDTHAEVEFKSLRSKARTEEAQGVGQGFCVQSGGGRREAAQGQRHGGQAAKEFSATITKNSRRSSWSASWKICWSTRRQDALARRLTNRYGIAPAKADELADITLEPNYASLSREAMRKLLPLMERGFASPRPRRKCMETNAGRLGLRDFLPPVLDAVPQLRNPVVCRGLTELRKVVNALIREYGKPDRIRVELARDLKKSRQQREDLTKQNRENEKTRDAARRKIAERLRCDERRRQQFRHPQGPARGGMQLGMSLHGKVDSP